MKESSDLDRIFLSELAASRDGLTRAQLHKVGINANVADEWVQLAQRRGLVTITGGRVKLTARGLRQYRELPPDNPVVTVGLPAR